MSRVEENRKIIEHADEAYEKAINEAGGLQAMLLTNPNVVNLIIGASKYDVIVDISRSLAMIADDLHYYRQYESEVIERG